MSKKQLYILVLCLSLAGYSWLFWNIRQFSTNEGAIGACMFRNVTGIPCPSCGTTHSVISIINGHFMDAAAENPLGFLVALMLILFPGWIIFDLITRKKSFFVFYLKMETILRRKWIAYPAIIFILINWIVNIQRTL
jgi:hypothetical protein